MIGKRHARNPLQAFVNRYFSLFRHFKIRTHLLFAAFVATSAAFELASLWVLKNLLLLLLFPGASTSGALGGTILRWQALGLRSLPVVLVGVFAFFLIKSGILLLLWRAVIYRLGKEQHDFSIQLFSRYLRLPYLRYIDRSKMILHQNLNIAITQMFIFSALPFMQLVLEAIVALGIGFYLVIASPVASLALAVWIAIVFGVFHLAIVGTAVAAGAAQRESYGRTLRVMQDALRDVKAIRLWGREDFFSALFNKASAPFARAWSYERLLQQASRFTIEPVLVGSLVVFAMALELSGASAATIVVDLSVFAAAGLRLLPAANRSIGLLHTLAFYRADLDEVWAEMTLPVEQLAPRPAASLPPPFQHAVRLEGIEARYVDGTDPVLHDVDLQIASGEKVAVVGGSGSGKSTLLNVLLGFVPASAGRVLFDGSEDRPLARFRRSAVAFVPQTILLLDDTVLANILFGLDAADEERIWKCLQIADFADRVRRMPEGLQARVGEDGVKLSGGERQRLALARAIYQQPAFLVLDEATSQIDIRTEHVILERLFAAMPDLTLVMATHRTESAAFFSRRIVIEGGTARNPVPEPARQLS